MQKSIFSQKFKKVCVLQRRACTQIQNFKRNYLENYNDSEHAVKTKNAPFFMIFSNISFFHMVVTDWTGPLKDQSTFGELMPYDRAQNLEHFLLLRHHLKI